MAQPKRIHTDAQKASVMLESLGAKAMRNGVAGHEERLAVMGSSWSGRRVAWALAGLVAWGLIDSASSRVIAYLPSAVSLVAGYVIWVAAITAIAWVFVYGLRRLGAPSSVWLGVLGWNVIRLVALVAVWVLFPQLGAGVTAGVAITSSVIHSLSTTAAAYFASRAS